MSVLFDDVGPMPKGSIVPKTLLVKDPSSKPTESEQLPSSIAEIAPPDSEEMTSLFSVNSWIDSSHIQPLINTVIVSPVAKSIPVSVHIFGLIAKLLDTDIS